jgi:hypothetical protein
VFDRRSVYFYSDHRAGGLSKKGAAIPFARRDIENVEAPSKVASEEVAMKMFNLDLTGRISGKTFSGTFERLDRSHPLKQLTHLNSLVDLQPSCFASNPTAQGFLLWNNASTSALCIQTAC